MSFSEKLQQIELLHRQIEEWGPLPDEVLKKVNYKFRLEWNYYSNSMEGNSLTQQETRSVMVGNITVDGKPIKDVLEMKGHDDVIATILKMGKGELNISEKRIKEIHKGIMHEEDPEKVKQIGQWKTEPNYLYNYKNERFDFAEPTEVPERMHKLINWLNSQKEKLQRGDNDALHPIEIAFRFHLDYISIHPFYNGNGRTARVFTNLILINYGYPPIYIKKEEKDVYYQYLADIQGYGGEPDLFYDFMAGLLLRSLQIVMNALEGKEIDEPNDWEKKLSLLKKQLVSGEGVKMVKSGDVVHEVISNALLPLAEKVMNKLAEFDDLFAEKRILFSGVGGQYDVQEISEIKSHIVGNSPEFMHQINFVYSLNGFRKSGINTFSAQVKLVWQFEQFMYRVYINDYNKSVIKLYHHSFTQEEIDELVNQCGIDLLRQIEKQLEKN